MNDQHVAVHEVRERSQFGDFIEAGVASFDNGASAILTARAQLLRNTLFKVDWNGYMPIDDVKAPDAWNLSGASFMLADKERAAAAPPYWRPLGVAGDRPPVRDARGPAGPFAPDVVSLRRHGPGCRSARGPDFQSWAMSSWTASIRGKAILQDARRRGGADRDRQDRGDALTLNELIGPAVVVLNDSYYPGWRVDDQLSGERLNWWPRTSTSAEFYSAKHALSARLPLQACVASADAGSPRHGLGDDRRNGCGRRSGQNRRR